MNKPKNNKKFLILFFSGIIVLLFFVFLSLILGSLNLFTLDNEQLVKSILLLKRVPRTFTAILAGSALATCGLILQSYFRNPLAGPSVLGISSGAGLGIAFSLMGSTLLGFNATILQIISAPLGAMFIIIPILIVASRFRSSMVVLLFGLLTGYLVNSLVTILIHFSPAQEVKSYLNWTFGSFTQVRLEQLPFFGIIVLLFIVFAFYLTPKLNSMQLGSEYAGSMGLNIKFFKIATLVIVSILTGVVTLYCGPVAFIGISAPHFSRLLLRSSDHRKLLPFSVVIGALLAVIADIISRMPGLDISLPLNAILALIGVPALLSILLQSKGGGEYES